MSASFRTHESREVADAESRPPRRTRRHSHHEDEVKDQTDELAAAADVMMEVTSQFGPLSSTISSTIPPGSAPEKSRDDF